MRSAAYAAKECNSCSHNRWRSAQRRRCAPAWIFVPFCIPRCADGELRSALAIAGVDGSQLIRLGVPDQEVCRSLVATTQGLAHLFKVHNIEIVLTHAFEGGHPDHDGVAFCVHAASRLLGA